MRDTLALDADRCTEINELRKRLKLSQDTVSRLSGYAQGTISNLLRAKAVDRRAIEAALVVLRSELERAATEGRISAEERRRGVTALDRAEAQAVRPSRRVLGPLAPGGRLDHEAPNCLMREIDDELADELDNHPFSIAVDGPPLSGKSTALGRWIGRAEDYGFRVAYLDCRSTAEELIGHREQISWTLTGLANNIADAWGLRPPDIDLESGPAFLRWIERARRGRTDKSGLVVLDGLTLLKEKALGPVSGTLRALQGRRAALNLSLAVERTPATRKLHRWMLDSVAVFYPRFETQWLGYAPPGQESGYQGADEVDRLAHGCGVELGAELAAGIKREFCGQPYLTHWAVATLKRHPEWDLDELVAEAERPQAHSHGLEGAHRRALTGLPEPDRLRELDSRDAEWDPRGESEQLFLALGLLRLRDEGLVSTVSGSAYFKGMIERCRSGAEPG